MHPVVQKFAQIISTFLIKGMDTNWMSRTSSLSLSLCLSLFLSFLHAEYQEPYAIEWKLEHHQPITNWCSI